MSSIRRAQLTERCDEHEMSWPTSLHRPLNNSAQHFILKLELLASSWQWKQNDTQAFCVEWWGGRMLVVGCFKVRRGMLLYSDVGERWCHLQTNHCHVTGSIQDDVTGLPFPYSIPPSRSHHSAFISIHQAVKQKGLPPPNCVWGFGWGY